MKTILRLFLLFNFALSFAQTSNNFTYPSETNLSNYRHASHFGKNILSVESSMFDRGLIGLSYIRLFVRRDHFLVGTGGGLGIGKIPFGERINQFYFSSLFFSLIHNERGKQPVLNFNMSLDLRYLDYHDVEYVTIGNETNIVPSEFEGLFLTPYLGLSVEPEKNWIIQMRFSPLSIFSPYEHIVKSGGAGISVGRFF